jgi:uncharacterized protein GlcG (DUF336 family)
MKTPNRGLRAISLKRAIALNMTVVVGSAMLLCARVSAQESGGAHGSAGAPASASAQGSTNQSVVMQRSVSLSLAKAIAEATLAACREKGYHTAAAVVDRAGQVLVILRDEQGTSQLAEMARRKAYTARMFRTTTLEFQKRTADNPQYAGQRNLPDILALSGGVPIKVGDETIGAVGSAGSTLEQDDACAKAGVAKVADLLK